MTILCQNKSEIQEHFWPIRLAGLIEAKLRIPLRPSAGELAQPAEFGPRPLLQSDFGCRLSESDLLVPWLWARSFDLKSKASWQILALGADS